MLAVLTVMEYFAMDWGWAEGTDDQNSLGEQASGFAIFEQAKWDLLGFYTFQAFTATVMGYLEHSQEAVFYELELYAGYHEEDEIDDDVDIFNTVLPNLMAKLI